jgi:hypothetical protein
LNKAAVPDHLEGWICGDGLLPPAGHGGEGSELRIASSFSLQGRFFVELNHVGGIHAPVIFCRQGGMSSTSMMEALRIRRWSSMLPRRQVVRPRRLGGSQRLWFYVGRRPSSALPLLLGGNALRTPAFGGGDARGLDCFASLVPGCFLQSRRPYLQISGSFGRVDVRSFLQNCTCHTLMNGMKR